MCIVHLLMPSILPVLFFLSGASEAYTAYSTYTAELSQLSSSGVFGDVTIFTTPTGMFGVGSAVGLEANLSAEPVGANCSANNGCGVHVHSGTACTDSGTQGGHYFAAGPDPWVNIRYTSTDAAGSAKYTFSLAIDSTAIDGKPFIVHNNAGARVACGIIARVRASQAANLSAINNSGVTGSVTLYSTGNMIVGAGWAAGLEANLSDASNGGTDCALTNGCGVHVHTGFDCANSSGQGGHLKTIGGLDPWTDIRYSSTSAEGVGNFVFAVDTDNAVVSGRAFVVHDEVGRRVACGILSRVPQQPKPQPESTTTTTALTITTTKMPSSFVTSSVYIATLTQLTNSVVSGDIAIFVTTTGLMGVGSATGLEANLTAAPDGYNCTQPNGCGVHVHSGTSCADSNAQGGHYFTASPDPWATIKYHSTDANGSSAFMFSITTTSTEIEGKPFILHNNAGQRVACGILSPPSTNLLTSGLSPLSSSGVFGSVTIYEKSNMVIGVGWASGLEPNLSDSTHGGTDCSSTNGCGVHVHSGSDCGSILGQEGHLTGTGGEDPWTTVRYHRTSAEGLASFLFSVRLDNADLFGKVFIVHNNAGDRVSCGQLSFPTTTSATTTTTTMPHANMMSFSAYPVYAVAFAELGGSGVYGDVAVFATPTGLVGAGRASGLEPGLESVPLGTHCTEPNACGVHVHSGTACTDADTQGGHYFLEDSDPWTDARYSRTDSDGDATFSFSATTLSTSIEGKPFIVHNNAGARVACGILTFVNYTMSATLHALSSSGVIGSATLHTTRGLIVGAGWATGLDKNLVGPTDGGIDCTEKNGCGVHVHSGSTCANTDGQGGHLNTMAGVDPWTSVRYMGTSSMGFAQFVFAVESDNTGITGKPFVVHGNLGDRVSCGVLLSTSSVYTADLVQLGNSGVSGTVTISVTPTGLVGVGRARGLESNLAVGTDCNAPNGCGAHVHSGMACTNTSTQGGHYYSTSSDPWATVRYTGTDSSGFASFTFSVIAGVNDIGGKPFIVHNNAGGRVACGILSLAQAEDLDGQTDSKPHSILGAIIGIGLGGGTILVVAMCCLCWCCCKKKPKSEIDNILGRSVSFHPSQPQDNHVSVAPSQTSFVTPKAEDEELNVSSHRSTSSDKSQPLDLHLKSSSSRILSAHNYGTGVVLSSRHSSRQQDELQRSCSGEDELEGAFEV